MRRVATVLLLALSIACSAPPGAGPAPPALRTAAAVGAPGGATLGPSIVDPTSALEFQPSAQVLATAQSHVYRVYLDVDPARVVPMTCQAGPPVRCQSDRTVFADISTGRHTVSVSAADAQGEGGRSEILEIERPAPPPPPPPPPPPDPPTDLRIVSVTLSVGGREVVLRP